MSLIKLDNVSKLYGFGDATTVALDDINLIIEKGEFVAIMGPSGSGKSTLMNIIGLLDRPSQGRYLLDNRSVARIHSERAAKIRRDSIGFIFQSFNLIAKLNVLDNVALPLSYKGVSQTKRYKMVTNILEKVGIQTREYFFPHQLSGGQSQCAAIARALVNNPKLIIADEPTGNLDSMGSRMVMELLSEIHQNGNTILFVTHNPDLTRYATRVVYMQDGAIIHDQSTTLGKVATNAHKMLYSLPQKTIEDDLAGVSLLMKTRDNKDSYKKTNHSKKNKGTRRKKK